MISVGIITAPRPNIYLGNSLDSYFAHWDYPPHIFAEPGSPTAYFHRDRTIYHQNESRLGCPLNWFSALKWLYHNTDTPWIMICEDDILWRPTSSEKTRAELNRIDSDTIGFVSPYCAELCMSEIAPSGWQECRQRRGGWCGALSICLPRQSAKLFMDNADLFMFKTAERTASHRILHLDYAIGEVVRHFNKVIWTHNPTLVLHMGEESTHQSNTGMEHHISRRPAL